MSRIRQQKHFDPPAHFDFPKIEKPTHLLQLTDQEIRSCKQATARRRSPTALNIRELQQVQLTKPDRSVLTPFSRSLLTCILITVVATMSARSLEGIRPLSQTAEASGSVPRVHQDPVESDLPDSDWPCNPAAYKTVCPRAPCPHDYD